MLNMPRPTLKALVFDLLGKTEKLVRTWRAELFLLFFSAARTIEILDNGNHLVKLSRDSALGNRGLILELPMDQVMFRSVQRSGEWSFQLSQFLGEGLDGVQTPEEKSALLDIGANTGLVTLQIMNLVTGHHDYFLFEPIPRHVSAIHRNLGTASSGSKVHVIPVALSNKNGSSDIFSETKNHGNSSLWQTVVGPPGAHFRTRIETVDTGEYFANFRHEFSRFVVKSDTQGMDAVILARLPPEIWQRVERAAVEVWAIPEVESSDVDALIEVWREFRLVSWASNFESIVDLAELRDFWLGQTGQSRDLYMVK